MIQVFISFTQALQAITLNTSREVRSQSSVHVITPNHIDILQINRLTSTKMISLVVELSKFLTTYHEVPGSIPGFTMGIFP
jgi:hypothetical protein